MYGNGGYFGNYGKFRSVFAMNPTWEDVAIGLCIFCYQTLSCQGYRLPVVAGEI